MFIDCDCRVNKRSILKEYKRKDALSEIIKRFADKIDSEGGFTSRSKTAKKCKGVGTANGIRAMMERWFLVQELYGVLYTVFVLFKGK